MLDSSIVDDKESENDKVFNLRETVYQPDQSNIDKESILDIEKNKKKTNLNLSINERPALEIGNLDLMKSDRDLTQKSKIFQSDRVFDPYQDTSYKLIQNKNGIQNNLSWNINSFKSSTKATSY